MPLLLWTGMSIALVSAILTFQEREITNLITPLVGALLVFEYVVKSIVLPYQENLQQIPKRKIAYAGVLIIVLIALYYFGYMLAGTAVIQVGFWISPQSNRNNMTHNVKQRRRRLVKRISSRHNDSNMPIVLQNS